jgi:VCBS repeat-containing protein
MSTKVVTAPASQAKRPVRSHKPAQQAEHQPAVTEDEARLAKDDSEQDVSVAPANEEETAPVESETSMAGEYTFGSALAEAAASSGSLISDAHRADEVGFGAFGDDDGSTPLLLAAVGLAALGLIFIVSDSGGDDEVVPVNRAPTITAPAAATTAEDTALTIAAPVTSDPDTGDTVTVTATVAAAQGTIAKQANGSFIFTPAANFNGAATITYSATDGKVAAPVTATQTVTVTAVNDAPTITVPTVAAIDEDSAAGVTFTVATADPDAGATVTTTASVAAAQGTVTKNADGTFTFKPAANFNGTAVITLSSTDGVVATPTTATLNITVNPVNDPATLSPLTATTAEDTALNLSDIIVVTDVDGPAASVVTSVTTQPTNGTISLVGGDVIYTPNADFNGTDTVGFTLVDGGTPGSATSTFTVTITITPVDEGPVVTPFSIDIGTGSVAIVKDAGTANFNFTDNSEATTNVEITNFTNNDKITVTNAVSTDYNFSRDLLNDINDLVITYTDPGTGATNRIYIQDVLPDTGPVNSLASATTAMGFTFMTFA